ncbi:MAG: hypothetical protein ABSF91_14505 [Bacteroidota bacterium]|jgi:hypothetical protein
MKVKFLFILTLILASSAFAQFPPSADNEVRGGLGMTWIDNQPFYAVHVRPEFTFSNIGLGLDLLMEFDSQGHLRKADFQQFSDYVRVLRYIRYNKETDPVYVKVGALDYVTVGHGSIINQYNNSPSFDARKSGLQFNLNSDLGGIQTVYGNFAQRGVAGIRGFFRPLQLTSASDIPIISNIEVGATYATDFDKYARIESFDSTGSPVTNGSMNIVGADIGLPLVKNNFVKLVLYADYVKILDFGSGATAGIMFDGDATDLLKLGIKLERRFNGDNYMPSYFNSFYELERVNTQALESKSLALRYLTNNNNGLYGQLLIRLVNTFDIVGSFEKLDTDSSGILHVFTNIAPKDASFIARAGYDKVNIADFSDLVTTDNRSLLFAEIGYKPIDYIIVSTVYMWTFAPVYDDNKNVTGYETQKKIEPRITFVVPIK